ncbi:MAG: proteasome accessory factor PafA2 family protein [Verrucomicrobiae bacterium]|nr:proteasome accessory factor PafA2 family protein [Verrucomicrobiae bacterium]
MNRVVGLETEYGCLTDAEGGPVAVVQRIRDRIFQDGHGLSDLHQRDWDEPAGNGGFLFNGGRCYVDMGHLEYCTPECRDLRDLIRFDKAGDRLIEQAVETEGMAQGTSFVRNNIDYYSGATFGCHENYLLRRDAPLTEASVQSLLTFLTLRMLITGAGRVRASPQAEARMETLAGWRDADFQVSQRADFINNDLFEWVQFNRAIINTRDEPLADPRRFRRLHLLHGDTSVLPATLALKVGATSLVLDLLEIGQMPDHRLADAVLTFRSLSHIVRPPWRVSLADGTSGCALEMLRSFLETAEREFRGRDSETDDVLDLWDRALAGLEGDQETVVGVIDWVTKRWLFEQFRQSEGLAWDDPWLQAQDLEFHAVAAARNIAFPLARTPPEWMPLDSEVETAIHDAPGNTRAFARSRAMRALKGSRAPYLVDWEKVSIEGVSPLRLADPFDWEPEGFATWLRRLKTELAERNPGLGDQGEGRGTAR